MGGRHKGRGGPKGCSQLSLPMERTGGRARATHLAAMPPRAPRLVVERVAPTTASRERADGPEGCPRRGRGPSDALSPGRGRQAVGG
jgi:hypothetical protein